MAQIEAAAAPRELGTPPVADAETVVRPAVTAEQLDGKVPLLQNDDHAEGMQPTPRRRQRARPRGGRDVPAHALEVAASEMPDLVVVRQIARVPVFESICPDTGANV